MKGFVGPIGEIARGIYDGPHATPAEASSGPIFLGIGNVTENGRLDLSKIRHLSEDDYPRWTRRVTPEADDIVFSYEATLHRYAIIPEGFRGCLGRRMALIRPDTKRVVPRFLHYYFLCDHWRSVVESNVVSGATVDRIPLTRFPDLEVRIPDMGTQRRIAKVLSSYDRLIENNQRRIKLLEQSARLLYKEWFVHLRFPGHERVKIKEGVPEGWTRKPLGEVAPLNYGRALKKEDRLPGSISVYGSSGIVGTHNRAGVHGPTIIVGRKGNVGSVYWSSEDCCAIDTVYYIRSENCSFRLYHALEAMLFISTDVAVPGLNRDFAHSRQVLTPSPLHHSLYEDTVGPLFQQIDILRYQSAKLEETRDLLIPYLMNHEVAA